MEIKIKSLKDAEKYIQILFEKNGFTNQKILDEITHLRTELKDEVSHLRSELKTEIAATNKRLDVTNDKLDENTLATKVLEKNWIA